MLKEDELFGKRIISVVEGLHAQRQKRNKRTKNQKIQNLSSSLFNINCSDLCKTKKEAEITGTNSDVDLSPSVPNSPTFTYSNAHHLLVGTFFFFVIC